MTFEIDEAALAATLVALGFPGDHAHYAPARAVAVDRFLEDAEFRRLARAVARGLGLRLLEVTREGEVVLISEPHTPFTPTQETLLPASGDRGPRRRQLAVLALLAAVAELFPTEDALAEVDASREVRPADVVQLLVSRAEAVSREPVAAGSEAAARDEELVQAFALVRQVQPSVATETGRESSASLQGIVTSVLRDLATKGLLREDGDGTGPVFRPGPALAAHVRHLLDREELDAAIEGLRAARRRGA